MGSDNITHSRVELGKPFSIGADLRGTPPFLFHAERLPEWLHLNAANGELSGTASLFHLAHKYPFLFSEDAGGEGAGETQLKLTEDLNVKFEVSVTNEVVGRCVHTVEVELCLRLCVSVVDVTTGARLSNVVVKCVWVDCGEGEGADRQRDRQRDRHSGTSDDIGMLDFVKPGSVAQK